MQRKYRLGEQAAKAPELRYFAVPGPACGDLEDAYLAEKRKIVVDLNVSPGFNSVVGNLG
jgi:hypothetical protein